MPHLMATHLETAMRECLDECLSCYTTCEAILTHCLQLGGQHADPDHIRLLADCARICAVSADFMIRRSDAHMQICGVCAEACRRCAESCEQMAAAA